MDERENKPAFKPDIPFWIWSLGLIGFFFILVWPFSRHPNPGRIPSSANSCINNLRQIDAAACQFALENHKTNGESINFPNDLTPYIKLNSAGSIPPCPSGGTYHISKVGEPPTCSLGTTVTPAHVLP